MARRKQPTVRLRTIVRGRGPWIFRKMVRDADPRTEAGSVVRVVDRNGTFVGQAFWNKRSEVALRILSRREQPVVDDAWFRETARRAVALRRELLGLDAVTDAYRVVFSEADNLPDLIADRYGPVLSCRVGSLGIYRSFGALSDGLREALGCKVVHVTADPKIAKREGFPIPDTAGTAARATIHEHGLAFDVDCARGHKTGFFLDQRDSRLRIRGLAEGRRVLDLYSYTGGFALNAARGGAKDVVAVDLDEAAVEQGRANAARNDLGKRVRFEHADAFAFLRDMKPGSFDLMIVDPAKQAFERRGLAQALSYYEDLNALAFEKSRPGGLVLTCSCTGVVSEPEFLEVLQRAADRVGKDVTLLEITGAPADHPVPIHFQRARYLKCVLARVGSGTI